MRGGYDCPRLGGARWLGQRGDVYADDYGAAGHDSAGFCGDAARHDGALRGAGGAGLSRMAGPAAGRRAGDGPGLRACGLCGESSGYGGSDRCLRASGGAFYGDRLLRQSKGGAGIFHDRRPGGAEAYEAGARHGGRVHRPYGGGSAGGVDRAAREGDGRRQLRGARVDDLPGYAEFGGRVQRHAGAGVYRARWLWQPGEHPGALYIFG